MRQSLAAVLPWRRTALLVAFLVTAVLFAPRLPGAGGLLLCWAMGLGGTAIASRSMFDLIQLWRLPEGRRYRTLAMVLSASIPAFLVIVVVAAALPATASGRPWLLLAVLLSPTFGILLCPVAESLGLPQRRLARFAFYSMCLMPLGSLFEGSGLIGTYLQFGLLISSGLSVAMAATMISMKVFIARRAEWGFTVLRRHREPRE